MPPRSNDGVHLAVAIRLGVDEIATYNRELQVVVQSADLAVFAPS